MRTLVPIRRARRLAMPKVNLTLTATCGQFKFPKPSEHHRVGSTHAPETQIRRPLQSVSLVHPAGEGAVSGTLEGPVGGGKGAITPGTGAGGVTGAGTHPGLSCWQALTSPVMQPAFSSFTC